MRAFFFSLLFCYSTLLAKGYEPFLSFTASKSELIKIYATHKWLPLSGCHYYFDPKGCSITGLVDFKSCAYKVQEDPLMASQIQWMHVLDPFHFGSHFRCLREKTCTSTYKQKKYQGIRCCKKQSTKFKTMYADMHNIIPVIGEFRKLRKGSYFKEPEVAPTIPGIMVRDEAKGMVARTYLYMIDRYDVNSDPELKKMWLRWHHQHPPTLWEKKKNRLMIN